MKPAAGFALIEALVTLLVLSIGLLGLGQLQARLWRGGGDLHAGQTAFLLTQDTLESARLDKPPPPRESSDNTYRLELERAPLPAPLSGLTTTRVTLRWRRPSGEQSLALAATLDTATRPEDARWLLPTP